MTSHVLKGKLLAGVFFSVGVLSIVLGQFVLSTTLFGLACLATNIQPVKAKPVRI